MSGMAASPLTDAYIAPPCDTYCRAFSQKSVCTCTRNEFVLVSGDGSRTAGYFCQSLYSRGISDFIPPRRASIKLLNHDPVIQALSSLKLGGCCPATAWPS